MPPPILGNTTTTGENAAGPLTGTELVRGVQGGANVKMTTAAIAGLALPLAAKGDLVVQGASASDRLPVGTDGQTVYADSTQPLGIRWGAAGVSTTDLANNSSNTKGLALAGVNATLAYSQGTGAAKLGDWVSPTDYPWLADKTGTTDATVAINACYQWCKTNGKSMRLLNGTYKVQTATATFELPRDDGSYSPSIGAGETTLSPETAVTMPVALVFDGAVQIAAESDDGVVLQGPWTYTSSSINTSQLIGVLFGANKDSYCTVRANLGRLNGFMLPVVVQGAMARSRLQATIDGAAIAACVQSADGSTAFDLEMVRCFAGCIIGGWWLQRNRALGASNMPSSFGGSYPASDIFRSCWGENIAFDRLEWQAQPVFNARADLVDTFFNTYFFKSANSQIYPAGRATVNADSGFTSSAGYPTYRGVFGFAAAIISRNGRYGSNIALNRMLSSGSSRGVLYMNAGSGFDIKSLYFENCGLVDPTGGVGSGNIMGTGRADPYRAGAQTALGLILDAEASLPSQYGLMGGFNNAPGVPALDQANRRVNWPTAISTSSVAEFTNGARIGAGSAPFGAADAVFQYNEKPFPSAPVISIGGTDQTGWSNDYASYSRVGNLVFFRFSMSKASPAFTGTGSVTVKNLPLTALAGGCINVAYFSNYVPAGEIHCITSGTTIQFGKGANRSTDVTQADLTSASAGVLTVEGFYRVS